MDGSGTVTLYLVQHGAAVPKAVDPGRPLSDRSRADGGGWAVAWMLPPELVG